MNIIFVSNISWSLFNFRKGIMVVLRERGHKVSFCATLDGYSARLEAQGFKFIPVDIDRKGTSFIKDLCLVVRLYNIYKKEKPDFVFHNSIKPNIYGTIAARLAGTRCVNTVSGLGYVFIRKNLYFNLVKFLYTLACTFSEKTFFQNKDDLQLFLDNRLIDADKCALVAGSGVNTEFFKPSDNKHIVSSKQDFTFLYLGRILWDKGIGELIGSVRMLKKHYPLMKLNLLGMIDKGNPAGISFQQIQEWQDKGFIKYCGETADVRPYLASCDCVILPSYREGIPKALLEAAAMELPVIATDVPGCRNVVEHGITGFLVEVKDTLDLAKAMEKMIKMSQSQRQEMGKKGREKVIREYSEKAVIKEYCTQIGL